MICLQKEQAVWLFYKNEELQLFWKRRLVFLKGQETEFVVLQAAVVIVCVPVGKSITICNC